MRALITQPLFSEAAERLSKAGVEVTAYDAPKPARGTTL